MAEELEVGYWCDPMMDVTDTFFIFFGYIYPLRPLLPYRI